LRGDADTQPLIDLIKKIQTDCGQTVVKVTIDTLSRAISGGDENSSVDMGHLVRHFDLIREKTEVHLAVIHHTGKDKAKGARGHSLLRAATDTEIEITDGKITVTKQRDLDGAIELRFTLKPIGVGIDQRGKAVTSCWVDVRAGVRLDLGAGLMKLTRVEHEILEKICSGVRQEAGENGAALPFDWERVGFWTPTRAMKRPTIIGHLSALSEKGYLEKLDENQYVLRVSVFVGYCRGLPVS
jgi:hypothetical protein